MASLDQISIGGTTYDINDKRMSTTAVTTATHILTSNSGVSSIAPITVANAKTVLGIDKTLSLYAAANAKSVNMSYAIAKGYSLTMLVTFIKYADSTGGDNTQVFLVTATFGGTTVKRMSGNTDDNIRFYWKSGELRCKSPVTGNTQFRVLSIPSSSNLTSLSLSSSDDISITGYTQITIAS